MSERARALADQFASANGELLAVAGACTDADWQRRPPGDAWTVGLIARHVAEGHDRIIQILGALLDGRPLPAWATMGREEAERLQAAWAAEAAQHPRADTLDLLRAGGAAAAAFVAGLRDDQLDRPAPSPRDQSRTIERAIEGVLVGHTREHLASVRAALDGGTAGAPAS
jgi:hypothetical protein